MGGHASFCSVSVAIVVLMLVSSAYCRVSGGSGDPGAYHDGLQPNGPEEIFRSDGGSMEIWSSNSSALRNAAVAVTRLILQPRGLALPKYCDASQLAYVLEGTGSVGLAYPWEQSVHVVSVNKGDVIAIARGAVQWLYNDGDDQFVVLGIADTSSGIIPGEYNGFYLEGAVTDGWGAGVLQAFDDELLSHAWDVDVDVVKQIKEGQKGTVIVRVEEDIEMPFVLARREASMVSIWDDYVYNIDEAEPDIEVEHGGSFNTLTSKKFPILGEILLSAVRLKLHSGALFGPAYTSNANLLVCVTEGSGRVQIVGSEKQLLDAEVTQGSILVVPQFYPAIVTSGGYGLTFVAMATSDSPLFSFLAGKNDLDSGVPIEVLAPSNNVSAEVQQAISDHRQNHAAIFPPRGTSSSKNKTSFVRNGLTSVLLLLSTLAALGTLSDMNAFI